MWTSAPWQALVPRAWARGAGASQLDQGQEGANAGQAGGPGSSTEQPPGPVIRVKLAGVSLPFQARFEQGLELMRLEPVFVPLDLDPSSAPQPPAEDRGYAVLARTWAANPGSQVQAVVDPGDTASRLLRAIAAAAAAGQLRDKVNRLVVRFMVTPAAVHLLVGYLRDPGWARQVRTLVDAAMPLVPELGADPGQSRNSSVVRVYETPVSLGVLPGAVGARWRILTDDANPFRLKVEQPETKTCVVVTAPVRLSPAGGAGGPPVSAPAASLLNASCLTVTSAAGEARYPGYVDVLLSYPAQGGAGTPGSGPAAGSGRGVGSGPAIDVVNGTRLEAYVAGVLRGEMPPAWEPEALRAQAVLIRTYALMHKGENAEKGYDVDDTVSYQRYKGAATSDSHLEAAASTAGIAATYEGRPIKAVYFSASGGHTESDQDIWLSGDEPYLEGVEDFDRGCPAYFWPAPARYTAVEFLSLLGFQVTAAAAGSGAAGDPKGGGGTSGTARVLGLIEPLANQSGRFIRLAVTCGDVRKVFSREDLRWKLGLKSPRFDVYVVDPAGLADSSAVGAPDGRGFRMAGLSPTAAVAITGVLRDEDGNLTGFSARATVEGTIPVPGAVSRLAGPATLTQACTVVLDGRGSGHAVGMSQWGAQGMARLRSDAGEPRYSYVDIVKHYFTGVELTRLY